MPDYSAAKQQLDDLTNDMQNSSIPVSNAWEDVLAELHGCQDPLPGHLREVFVLGDKDISYGEAADALKKRWYRA